VLTTAWSNTASEYNSSHYSLSRLLKPKTQKYITHSDSIQ